MTLLLITSLIIMMIINIMMFMIIFFSKKMLIDREKMSPFNCGFDPQSPARIPFSLHFFLITIIFLIFDVEIALIFPIIPLFKMINFFLWTKVSIFFLVILILGVYHEWNQNMLNWTN